MSEKVVRSVDGLLDEMMSSVRGPITLSTECVQRLRDYIFLAPVPGVDRELRAAGYCVETINQLEPAQRDRVAGYIAERFGKETTSE